MTARRSRPTPLPERAPLADPELMRLLAAGDLGALGALYDRYHASVLTFLRRAAPDPAEVDDLVHETFLTLPQAAPSYDGRASAGPFLIGIAARLVRRRRRFLARFTDVVRDLEERYLDRRAPSPEEIAEAAEDLAALDGALARLSEAKRLVYLMIEVQEMSGEEVSAALGIPLGTVWTRLHHARLALQRSLARRGKR